MFLDGAYRPGRGDYTTGFVNEPYQSSMPRTAIGIDTTNPKDLLGDNKVDFSQISPFALAHEACAMMDGTWKYGFRNWRDKRVRALVYTAAAMRHIKAWEEGEESADDSLVHHLGHARACLGIVLDAQETGQLVDDRVKSQGQLGQLMKRLGDWVINRRKYHEEKKASVALIGSNS